MKKAKKSKIRKFRKLELRKLALRGIKIRRRVASILQERYQRRLFRMKPQDELRLLVLQQWETKYQVELDYILECLLPYWHSKLGRQIRSKNGLGVRVTSLVGKVSEKILKEQIAKDFPNDENREEWKWKRRREIIASRKKANQDEVEDEFQPVKKSLLDYPTVTKFVAAYKKRVKAERKEFDAACNQKKNRMRRYRNSPW